MRCVWFLTLVFLFFQASAQITAKREFRAAWIATVSNIDFPSKPGLPSVSQQQEFIQRLDQLKYMGCNAVIVQIRPAADAFYPSTLEPWSRYLTGKQGQPPFPFYDPLAFMIEQTHLRNMEFHAWFNPFRALTDNKKNPNPPNHVTRTHPDWIVNYDGKALLNPGIPDARSYVQSVILDVVRRYDIDAVHLDDYFYPYRVAGIDFNDGASFIRYGLNFTNRDDWRRNNVNQFVSSLSLAIKKEKSYVKFGISPFGVWRNQTKDPEGSPTRGGQTNYDDLYADIILWMKQGWIDYCLPQLYWEHGHRLVAFDVLLPWWEMHSYDRHVYYGLGVYRMLGNPRAPWHNANELMWQLRDVRNNTKNRGFSLYSASNFDKISSSITDSVHQFDRFIAFPPIMKWIDSIAPAAPTVKAIPSSQGTLLKWEQLTGFNPKGEIIRFAVYRFVNGEQIDLRRNDKIIKLTTSREFLDVDANKFNKCSYVITALDRMWNESSPSNIVNTQVP
ncbi:MAG: family 10 glycosylhydrolase [Bacteroidetes bacterium]|nr:family 10 glycosylhydrolase [Bacteroidota bacterium]